jgi:hypothetical protein
MMLWGLFSGVLADWSLDIALPFAGLKNHLSVSSVVGLFDVIGIPTETCQGVGRRSPVIAR